MREVKYHHISSFVSAEGRVSFRKPITVELEYCEKDVVAHYVPLSLSVKGHTAEEAVSQLEQDMALLYERLVCQVYPPATRVPRRQGEKLFAMIGSVDF